MSQESQELMQQLRYAAQQQLHPPAAPGARPPPPSSCSSAGSSPPNGPLKKINLEPNAAVPQTRGKTPRAPAPQTGCVARRTVILPPLSRLNRAQLENLAVQWEVDPSGETVAQIRGVLYELDKDMREGRRPAQAP